MSPTFNPSNAIDMTNERTWPASLGLLDWDSTNIVFTKRSLIEFLKKNGPLNVRADRYTGTTVDPNFGTIAKLPRYAKFGTISQAPPAGTDESTEEPAATITAQSASNAGNGSKPSRRVRAAPGGTHADIFGPQDDEDDALANAPPRPNEASEKSNSTQAASNTTAPDPIETPTSGFRPTRRVRTGPGGASSIGSIFGNDDNQDEFKPTRRVREGPGGQDHIDGLF